MDTVRGNGVFGLLTQRLFFNGINGQWRPFAIYRKGAFSLFGGDFMNSDNNICNAARINFCGEPRTQSSARVTGNSSYDRAFFGTDKWDDDYCMNTTAWD